MLERAEVEFESGNIAFSLKHCVEFYDCHLEDGSLRRASSCGRVPPRFTFVQTRRLLQRAGGDFSVEASGKSYFRVNTMTM